MMIYIVYVVIISSTVTSSNHEQVNMDINELCNRDRNGTCLSCKYGMGSPESNCECSKKRCSNSACSYCTNLWYYPANGTCCRCSVNCKREYCTTEGECPLGCADGFYGKRCDKLCTTVQPNCKRCLSLGKEGILRDLYKMCDQCRLGMFPDREKAWLCVDCPSTCIGGECDPVNGSCTRGCVIGRWSSNCNKTCDKGCHSCRQTDGICESQDCTKPGIVEDRCLTNCNKNCKKINGTGMCMVKDGTCFDQCEKSFYGPYCNISCQSHCDGSDNICDRQSGYCLQGCDDGYFGLDCTNICQGCSHNICEQETGMCFVLQNVRRSDKWAAKTYLLVAGVPIACVMLGIVTLLVFSYIKKKRKQNTPSLYGTRHSTEVFFGGGTNSDAYAEIIEDDMCPYTFLENRDRTKPMDITPVSRYMTVPLDKGISCNVTFDDSMTSYHSLSENEVQDDLNRSQISTVNGGYLTVVHEWPTEPEPII